MARFYSLEKYTGRVSGHGAALSSASIDQDRSYWEVEIKSLPLPEGDVDESPFSAAAGEAEGSNMGLCRIGVSEALGGEMLEKHLPSVDDDVKASKRGWVVESCVLYAPALQQLKQGDVVGIAVQLSDFPMVQFFLNGSHLNGCDVSRISGTVFPAVSVSGGAELLVHFDDEQWSHSPPSDKFQPILMAQDMI
mmetsp:Transcript_37416/g.116952  ORF Transcript_37416/g.116952 Transcript_37416/m.116952 type:complete len:193 (-) Transcript_37416:1053-1631(-)